MVHSPRSGGGAGLTPAQAAALSQAAANAAQTTANTTDIAALNLSQAAQDAAIAAAPTTAQLDVLQAQIAANVDDSPVSFRPQADGSIIVDWEVQADTTLPAPPQDGRSLPIYRLGGTSVADSVLPPSATEFPNPKNGDDAPVIQLANGVSAFFVYQDGWSMVGKVSQLPTIFVAGGDDVDLLDAAFLNKRVYFTQSNTLLNAPDNITVSGAGFVDGGSANINQQLRTLYFAANSGAVAARKAQSGEYHNNSRGGNFDGWRKVAYEGENIATASEVDTATSADKVVNTVELARKLSEIGSNKWVLITQADQLLETGNIYYGDTGTVVVPTANAANENEAIEIHNTNPYHNNNEPIRVTGIFRNVHTGELFNNLDISFGRTVRFASNGVDAWIVRVNELDVTTKINASNNGLELAAGPTYLIDSFVSSPVTLKYPNFPSGSIKFALTEISTAGLTIEQNDLTATHQIRYKNEAGITVVSDRIEIGLEHAGKVIVAAGDVLQDRWNMLNLVNPQSETASINPDDISEWDTAETDIAQGALRKFFDGSSTLILGRIVDDATADGGTGPDGAKWQDVTEQLVDGLTVIDSDASAPTYFALYGKPHAKRYSVTGSTDLAILFPSDGGVNVDAHAYVANDGTGTVTIEGKEIPAGGGAIIQADPDLGGPAVTVIGGSDAPTTNVASLAGTVDIDAALSGLPDNQALHFQVGFGDATLTTASGGFGQAIDGDLVFNPVAEITVPFKAQGYIFRGAGGNPNIVYNTPSDADAIPVDNAMAANPLAADEEVVALDGIEVRMSSAERQMQIRSASGTIEIEGHHSLEQGSATEGEFGTKTLTTTWQNLDVTNESFSVTGAQEWFHFRRVDTNSQYLVRSRLGPSFINNSIIIERLDRHTVYQGSTEADVSGNVGTGGGTIQLTVPEAGNYDITMQVSVTQTLPSATGMAHHKVTGGSSGVVVSDTRAVLSGNGFGFTSFSPKKELVAGETLTMEAVTFGAGAFNNTNCRIFIRRVN